MTESGREARAAHLCVLRKCHHGTVATSPLPTTQRISFRVRLWNGEPGPNLEMKKRLSRLVVVLCQRWRQVGRREQNSVGPQAPSLRNPKRCGREGWVILGPQLASSFPGQPAGHFQPSALSPLSLLLLPLSAPSPYLPKPPPTVSQGSRPRALGAGDAFDLLTLPLLSPWVPAGEEEEEGDTGVGGGG